MRHFYILLNRIPELTKRDVDQGEIIDEVSELCSCIRNALFLSHDVRRDVEVHLVLIDEMRKITISGRDLRYLSPDERSICMLLIKLHERKHINRPWRGVYVRGFSDKQEVFPSNDPFIVPSEWAGGWWWVKSLKDVRVLVPLVPLEQVVQLEKIMVLQVKVQKKLLPSHVIAVLNSQLDRMED